MRTVDGDLTVGRTLPGRGGWLCAATAVACLDLATRRKAWMRAFRAPVRPRSVAELRRSLAKGSD